jgi:hypothetical protein
VTAKVVTALGCSGREACRWLGFNRSTLRYAPKPVVGRKRMLEEAIVAMSLRYPTEGYKKIAGQLRALGYRINKKQVQRGAGDETRTRDINLGKVALYQLSYTRICQGGTG